MTRRRYAVGAARILAATLLALAAVVPALLYDYVIAISAGLCGSDARWWVSAVAVAMPLLVVGSWGLLHGWWILVAWPAAVFAAVSSLMLADYLQTGAHGHCETITPYERIVGPAPRYSTMSMPISSLPRTNRTPAGEPSAIRHLVSSRL